MLSKLPTEPKLALLFPGQGAQFVGMGEDFPSGSWMEEAEVLSELPLRKLFREGPKERLDEDLIAQISVYTQSVVSLLYVQQQGFMFPPGAVAGHSMGIYAALVAAGSIDRKTGLQFAKHAGELSLRHAKSREFSMAVILGLFPEEIKKLSEPFAQHQPAAVSVACINTAKQCVVSGITQELEKLLQAALEHGAFIAALLPIHIPYHSEWMREVSEQFSSFLADFSIRDPKIPVIEPTSQRFLSSAEDIRHYLSSFLHEPQDWFATMEKLVTSGFMHFQEMGPGETLGRMLHWIDRKAEVLPVDPAAKLRAYGS